MGQGAGAWPVALPFLALLLAALAGCLGGGDEVSFRLVVSGESSGIQIAAPQVFKIASQGDWTDFWDRHAANLDPAPPAPAVDFASDMVIAVLDKQQPTAGYSLNVQRVLDKKGRLEVYAVRKEPGAKCVNEQVITQPFRILSLARSDSEVTLFLRTEKYKC
ncbi:MAG TPA: protease complex subunit PrcB family protein [Dehalococcoidia bacterium]|nr:protease complex subunit PrcB family protein [Dehalococcoidia bacterium]